MCLQITCFVFHITCFLFHVAFFRQYVKAKKNSSCPPAVGVFTWVYFFCGERQWVPMDLGVKVV